MCTRKNSKVLLARNALVHFIGRNVVESSDLRVVNGILYQKRLHKMKKKKRKNRNTSNYSDDQHTKHFPVQNIRRFFLSVHIVHSPHMLKCVSIPVKLTKELCVILVFQLVMLVSNSRCYFCCKLSL